MSIGLPRGKVKLSAYDPQWPQEFISEKVTLVRIFGTSAVAIEHVGSTAAPGLHAKPIIDIEVGLKTLKSWKAFVEPLAGVGYICMPERVMPDAVFMPKGSEARRTHYLHITQFGSMEWNSTLLFRDALRNDAVLRLRYAQLKQRLAGTFPNDRQQYTQAKTELITDFISDSS